MENPVTKGMGAQVEIREEEAILRTQDVHFQYDMGENEAPLTVLDGIDLSVWQGSFVALLGHNGSGKSTFAKHFNAILLPSGGTVYVKNIPTSDESRKFDVRRIVGMVLQNPDNQLVSTIVEEDVAFGPENLGVPPAEIRERVDDALRAVGMYDYRLHAPDKLSGGQKQRVAIGSALMCGKDLIILDEPTSGLDRYHMEQVGELLRQLASQGKAILVVTHDEELAAGWCDRIVNLGADDSGNNGSHASNPDASSPNPNASTNFATASTHERNAQ